MKEVKHLSLEELHPNVQKEFVVLILKLWSLTFDKICKREAMPNSRGWKALNFSERGERVGTRNHRWRLILCVPREMIVWVVRVVSHVLWKGKRKIPKNQDRFRKNRSIHVFPFPLVIGLLEYQGHKVSGAHIDISKISH